MVISNWLALLDHWSDPVVDLDPTQVLQAISTAVAAAVLAVFDAGEEEPKVPIDLEKGLLTTPMRSAAPLLEDEGAQILFQPAAITCPDEDEVEVLINLAPAIIPQTV